MRPLVPTFALTLALAMACLSCTSATADDSDETGDESQQGDPCPAPVAGVSPTYEVTLEGFPEIVDGILVADDADWSFTGTCTVTASSFADDQLSVVLDCPHPISPVTTVTITTEAAGLPAGFAVGASLEFVGSAYLNQGGDQGGGVFRTLVGANVERYSLSDASGVLFASARSGLTGTYGDLGIESLNDCPNWMPCSAGDISGYLRASSGAGSIDVEIGEVGLLEDPDSGRGWDVSLFQSHLGGCHGDEGGFSLVRRP